ncbi:hypothetical protein MUB24_16015 [Lederbergia sp. NSJ-179]|uniref:hypothetical protein n=1 Tax=Lederbergia sp. NSJ-179 TaxID=2931402 RepID=UPI001FD33FD2|nr:hypothetical protein [Lederbergia sp. NSJ-179]MCJ7842375.1 hypothetical protein [Lederbergia sp. NSJ-179]
MATIQGDALSYDESGWEDSESERPKMKAIPYCVWDNREPGEMRVSVNEIE